MSPAEIAAESSCFSCIPDPLRSLVFLANAIAVNGGSGGGGANGSIVPLTGSNTPTPAQGPASGGAVAYNEVPNLWTWNTSLSQWDQLV